MPPPLPAEFDLRALGRRALPAGAVLMALAPALMLTPGPGCVSLRRGIDQPGRPDLCRQATA